MGEFQDPVERQERVVRAKKSLTYLFMFAIVMFFAGLTSAYLVSKGSSNYWLNFKLPAPFWYSTGFILLSSLTIQVALVQARKGRKRAVAPWVMLSLALGVCFGFSQKKGWGELVDHGFALVSRLKSANGEYGKDYTIERRGIPLEKQGDFYYLPDDTEHAHPLNAEMDEYKNSASSYFFVLTWAHFLHVVGGLIALLVMSIKALMGRYGKEDHQGLWAGTVYWHFLAGVWVCLLLFLAYVH
jgi:cytochrome c oxidase subunit 3